MDERDETFLSILLRYKKANDLTIAIQNPMLFNALRDNFAMLRALERIYVITSKHTPDSDPAATLSEIMKQPLFLAQAKKL